jgi:glycosyltransferase involved in cell wall biosynthesis
MRLSVCICTRNRAGALATTLARLGALATPAGVTWELVVVDNGSTDDTAAVLASWRAPVPCRVRLDHSRGLGRVRNVAAGMASGEVILWTDDDVLVPEDWLVRYARAAAERPDHAIFGGEIRPVFTGGIPAWLAEALSELGPSFAARAERPDGAPVTAVDMPFGGNLVVRVEVVRRIPFDERLGYAGPWDVSGEECELVLRALDAGYRGSWVAGVGIDHMIPPERTSMEYLERHYRRAGATALVVSRMRQPGRMVAGYPPYVVRQFLEATASLAATSFKSRSFAGRIPVLKSYWLACGAMDACRRGLARAAAPPVSGGRAAGSPQAAHGGPS